MHLLGARAGPPTVCSEDGLEMQYASATKVLAYRQQPRVMFCLQINVTDPFKWFLIVFQMVLCSPDRSCCNSRIHGMRLRYG